MAARAGFGATDAFFFGAGVDLLTFNGAELVVFGVRLMDDAGTVFGFLFTLAAAFFADALTTFFAFVTVLLALIALTAFVVPLTTALTAFEASPPPHLE